MRLPRPICNVCNKKVCAVNYIKNGKRHYRSMCNQCGKTNKMKKPIYLWQRAGYEKDKLCFLCGFKSLYSTQMVVYHIDGRPQNTDFTNLRTVCLNCIEVVKRKEIIWVRGDLTVDY